MLRTLDQNDSCLLILLDLSTAFDTVKHDNLISLLENRMGISGTVLSWFSSFLHNRFQKVHFNHSLSNPTWIPLGVPQGSSLSPTLFNLFLEPLTNIFNISEVSYHMYADDTQLYMKISSPEDITISMSLCRKLKPG